jgi:hypothetical protein
MSDYNTLNQVACRWYFYQEMPGSWRWDAVGDQGQLLRCSERTFDSRMACVWDAKAHGYMMSAA